MKEIPIELIRTDGGTQIRTCATFQSKVDEYALAMGEGDQFPPLVVFWDGENYWLADGFHRLEACNIYMQARDLPGLDIDCEVLEGTRRDAILYACGANAEHGLPRTNADKRNAVVTLLRNPLTSQDENGVLWSDRAIARICKVDHKFVGKIRAEAVTGDIPSERAYTNKHGGKSTMNTVNIGAKAAQPEAKTPIVVVEPSAPEPEAAPEAEPTADETPEEVLEQTGQAVEFISKWDFIHTHLKEIDRAIEALPPPAVAAANFPQTLAHGMTVQRCLEIQRYWLEFTRLWSAREPEIRRYQQRQGDFIKEELNAHR